MRLFLWFSNTVPKFERRVLFIRRIDKWAMNESWSGHKLRDMTPYFSCHTPLLACICSANNIFPHSISPFLNVIGKKWLLPVWSFQTKVRQITYNRVIILYFILRRLSMITDLKRVDRLGKYFTQCEEQHHYIKGVEHSVWKSHKKSHSTLRAIATFTFWVDKS